jgi:hypothetical protein
MHNLSRRLCRLESQRFDVTGLVPNSGACFAYYENQFDRLIAGEDIGYLPLAVIDGIVEAADRAEQMQRARSCLETNAPGRKCFFNR